MEDPVDDKVHLVLTLNKKRKIKVLFYNIHDRNFWSSLQKKKNVVPINYLSVIGETKKILESLKDEVNSYKEIPNLFLFII